MPTSSASNAGDPRNANRGGGFNSQGSNQAGAQQGGQNGGQGFGKKQTYTDLPHIPDVEPAPVNPEPVDLSLIAAEPEKPRRVPLQNPALGGSLPSQGGITGYAGVFIP